MAGAVKAIPASIKMRMGFMASSTFGQSGLRTLGFLGLDAADDSVKDGTLCLLNRRDGVVDGVAGLPLQILGAVLRVSRAEVMLYAGNVCFQGAHVGRDFCAYRTPVSAGSIANGLDFLIDLFDCRCGSSTRLLLARPDLVMRFLLRSIRGIFSILREPTSRRVVQRVA